MTTRQPQRDEHLRSDDFLDAAKFPLKGRATN
ncbi:YceI family protein [Paenibacillus sp. XY044]